MNDAAGAAKAPDTYLIVLRHVLVAQDIAMTLTDFDPTAQVITAPTAAEALSLVDGMDRIAVAFVGAGPDGYRHSPLALAVEERGGRTILIGDEAEAQGEAAGYKILVRPFTTSSILAHLSAPKR